MPRSESRKACLCKICKGQSFLSSHVVSRHLQTYGNFNENVSEEIEELKHGSSTNSTSSNAIASDVENDEQHLELSEYREEHDLCISSPVALEIDDNSDIGSDDEQITLPSCSQEYLEYEPIDSQLHDNSLSDFEDSSSDSSDSETEELESSMETGVGNMDVSDDLFKEVFLNPTSQFNKIRQSNPLYPGATSSVLDALVHLFDWFTSHPSISKQAFSENLQYLHDYILPPGNLLPKSYQEAYQCIKPFLIPEIVYDVCPNDCIIFRKGYKNEKQCPICKEDRFKQNSQGQQSQIPRRTFIYLPLSTRMLRNFGTGSIAEALQSHQGNVDASAKSVLRDIHDSSIWKEAYSDKGMFCGDPRGLSLSLCLDGLNPWSKNKTNYSMWPIVLGQFNLPRKIRNLLANLILVGIIPAQVNGKEPFNLDPYLEVLVDELLCLTDTKIYDAYKGEAFNAKVDVLLHILDYQGIGKVFHMTGTGSYRGCSWCQLKGVYCKHLKKIIYLGNRRYLTSSDEMRNDTDNFPEKNKETRPEPIKRKFGEDLNYHRAYDNAKNPTQAKKIATATGCRGQYVLATKLPNFDRVSKVVPDAMHTIAVCMKHILYLISGKEPEDSLSVRNAEKAFNRFPECWVESAESCKDVEARQCSKKKAPKRKRDCVDTAGGNKKIKVLSSTTKLPSAPFRLKSGDIKIADQRASDIVVPSDCSFTPGPIFSKISRLNSHAFKEVATRGIAKYCLRGMLAESQRETLFLFFDNIAALCAEEQDPEQLPSLGENLNIVMARMERDFPASLQVITTHIIHHILDGINKFGPVHATWMFPYERFNSWLCRRAMSRKHPEATILKTYQIFEWCQYQRTTNGSGFNDFYFDGPKVQKEPSTSRDQHLVKTVGSHETSSAIEVDKINLMKMKGIYKEEVEEYNVIHQIYHQEKETARQQRRLRKFPPIETWIPEGRTLTDKQCNYLAGPKPAATSVKEYLHEESGRRPHKFKPGSVICQLGLPKFGVVDKIIVHKFVGCEYVWLFIGWYAPPKFHPESHIWFSEDVLQQISPIMITKVSRPLVIAKEGKFVWFLDAPISENQ